jgi:chemotaxis regulatin CheY-phosphate phosphatase CheZ
VAQDLTSHQDFQDLTRQKTRKLVGLVAEIEEQFLRLLAQLRIEDTGERVPAAETDGGAKEASTLSSQDLIDQLFQEVREESASWSCRGIATRSRCSTGWR